MYRFAFSFIKKETEHLDPALSIQDLASVRVVHQYENYR